MNKEHPSSPYGSVQKETPREMENQQLGSPSRQCSCTPVRFGQRLLSQKQCDNTRASSILTWSVSNWFPNRSLDWNQHEGTALLWC